MRKLVTVVAAVLLVLSFLPANAAATGNVIYASDYPDLPSAVSAWLAAEHAQTAGTLDLGTGTYSLTQTLDVAQPDGTPVFGTIRGDGPNLANIKCSSGIVRCLQFDDYWQGSLDGFSVTGAGYGVHAAQGNTDDGLVFAAHHQDLGACCGTIENVSSSGFARCWMLGDDQSPLGAAAEFDLTNVQANWCGIGWAVAGSNSLDFVFSKPNATQNGVTFQAIYGAPSQIVVTGGGATNDDQEFVYTGDCGTFSIAGYRAEGRTRPDLPLVDIGGCTGQQVSIRDSILAATTTYSPMSIRLNNAETFLTLSNNDLVGTVEHVQGTSTIDSSNNTIYTQNGVQPFSFSDPNCCGVIHLRSFGDHNASQVNGFWFGGWWPDQSDSWIYPPNAQPAPPAPTFTTGATVSGSQINTTVTSSLSQNTNVEVDLYDPSFNRVMRQTWLGQRFSAGQTLNFGAQWIAPDDAVKGRYTVMVGVFSPDWKTKYEWNSAAAHETV